MKVWQGKLEKMPVELQSPVKYFLDLRHPFLIQF